MTKNKVFAGIDIGGTNTVWGLTDLKGTIISKSTFKTRNYPDFKGFINELSSRIQSDAEKAGVSLISAGIGAPNANFFTGKIDNAANLAWKGEIDLRGEMAKKLNVPVSVTNDANAAAMGEMIFGAARGMKDFILLTLGTGVGSGIVTNGKLIYGNTGFAGELGHVIMVPGGRECGCGREGCLETYSSASGIVRTASQLLAEMKAESHLRSMPPTELNSFIIAEHAAKGDEVALEAFNYTAEMLAIAIINAVVFSSPEAVILAGGLAKAGDLLTVPLQKHLDDYTMEAFRGTFKVLHSALPLSEAAILGAAALAISDYNK